MKIGNRNSSKGFTLVELLVVISLLGIILVVAIPNVLSWINHSKRESRETLVKTLEMAGRSYGQSNSQALPKAVGESTTITASDLKKANYLKEDLIDSDDHSCMTDSIVRVYKYSSTGYTYTPYLYCDGDVVPDEITPEGPVVTVKFTDNKGNEVANQNVSIARVDIEIKGDSSGTISLDGYEYSITAHYGEGSLEKTAELYSSGTIKANEKTTVKIKKSLTDIVDITTITDLTVIVDAYNIIGGYTHFTNGSSYADTTPPDCRDFVGEAEPGVWDSTIRKRKVSVKCYDGDGSGCVRDKYVKTFTEEAEFGIITVEDNAGNKRDCSVRINLDWSEPTVTLTAYKRNDNGTKGEQVGSVVADSTTPIAYLKSYKYGYGADSWLNKANYYSGVYYEISVTDNVASSRGYLRQNAAGKLKNSADVNTLYGDGVHREYGVSGDIGNFSITDPGWRIGEYKVSDLAGNTSVIHYIAPLDINQPTCTSSGGSSDWTKGPVTLTGICQDDISGCVGNVQKVLTEDMNSTTQSPGTVYDRAGNERVCGNQTVKIDTSGPTGLTTKLYKWANNSTTPTLSSVPNLDPYEYKATDEHKGWSNRYIYSVPSGATDAGCGGVYYEYYTGGDVGSKHAKASALSIKKNGTSTIKWRACDALGNCSSYSTDETMKIDTVAPKTISIQYKYRSSAYDNDRCFIIPNNNCKFVAASTSVINDKRLIFASNNNKENCLNEIKSGLRGNSCTSGYTTSWSTLKRNNDTRTYNGSIFSINSGNGYIQLNTTASAFKVTDESGASGYKRKVMYVRTGTNSFTTDDSSNRYYDVMDGFVTSSKEKVMTTSNRGVTFKFYLEDYAGNTTTWTVTFLYTGVALEYEGDHIFWKYTPLNYPVNTQNSFFATGWTKRFYIRTFIGPDNVYALSSRTYYSDDDYQIKPGEGTCNSTSGCQLHGWYEIGGVWYFFNTDEFDINVVPDGSIIQGHSINVCKNSSQFLKDGYCAGSRISAWCNSDGACDNHGS